MPRHGSKKIKVGLNNGVDRGESVLVNSTPTSTFAEGLHVEWPMDPLQVMVIDDMEGALVVEELPVELGEDAGVVEK